MQQPNSNDNANIEKQSLVCINGNTKEYNTIKIRKEHEKHHSDQKNHFNTLNNISNSDNSEAEGGGGGETSVTSNMSTILSGSSTILLKLSVITPHLQQANTLLLYHNNNNHKNSNNSISIGTGSSKVIEEDITFQIQKVGFWLL
ncbi:hypothetical protein ACTFIU_001645 [Dictyostelium citrinum]